MILRKHRRRHHTLSYVVLSLLAFGITMPIVVGSRMDRLTFSGAAALAAVSDSYSLGAPLPLITPAGLLLERGTVSIARTQSAGTRTSEDMLNLLASGNARLVLDNATLVFASEADVAAVPPPIDAAAPLVATLLGSRFESLRINHGMITMPAVSNRRGLYLSDVNADISLRRKGVITAKGTFVYARRTLAFEATIGVVGDRKAAHRLPISASLTGELARVSLEGRVSLGDGLQISANVAHLETLSLRELAAWLGYQWPVGSGFEAFRADGNLDLVNSGLSLQKAELVVDGNEASGALFINFAPAHATLDATLAVRRLDLAPYLSGPGARTAAASYGSGWADVLRAAGLSGLPVLSGLEADVRLSADRVTVGSAVLGRGAATITAKNGHVTADVAELELERGGAGTLQLSLDSTRPVPLYTLRGKLQDVDLGEPLPLPASGVPLLAGRGDVSVDVRSAGRSVDDIVAGLAGQMRLSLPKSGRIGLDLAALMATAQAKEPVNGWRAAGGTATALDDLEARFDITNGLWTLRHGRARSGNAVFLGSGAVYPPGRSLDIRVSRTNGLTAATSSDDGVSVPAGAAQSVVVRGPWGQPQIAPAVRNGKAAEPLPELRPPPPPAPGNAVATPPGRG